MSDGRMIDELVFGWKQSWPRQCTIPALPEGTEENHEKTQSGYPASQVRLKLNTSGYKSKMLPLDQPVSLMNS